MSKLLGLVLVTAALGCAQKETPRRPEPVSPTSAPRTEPRKEEVVLADLDKPKPAAPAPGAQAAASDSAVTAGGVDDLSDLGSLDVISPEDARKSANEKINAQNAEAELAKLRAEINVGG